MKIIEFCKKYKYALTLMVFAAYLFFGENNLTENHKLNAEIKRLESELQHYNTMILNVKSQNALSAFSSKEEKEEYFRKQHHYKKENEDIFRIVASED
ncbi:MAG: septum formation initiator family protein [Bacteroidales bacterium]|jgi:cell division protein FtsB|nr:septum formation initiator family protein [Bacteroidales bacterium]